MSELSRILIIAGIFLILLGLFFGWSGKIHFFGKLPGDIFIQRKNFTFYFPLTTSLLISLILSFIIWLWSRR